MANNIKKRNENNENSNVILIMKIIIWKCKY